MLFATEALLWFTVIASVKKDDQFRADSLRCRSLLMKMARGYSYTSLSSNSIFFLYFCGLVYNSLFSPMSLLTFRPFFDKDTPHKMLESQRSICLMFQGEK